MASDIEPPSDDDRAVDNPADESATKDEGEDSGSTLDALYEHLAQVQHSSEALEGEVEPLRARLQSAETEVIAQRLKAAASGDHASVKMLAERQAQLQRGMQMLDDDPNADPFEQPPPPPDEDSDAPDEHGLSDGDGDGRGGDGRPAESGDDLSDAGDVPAG